MFPECAVARASAAITRIWQRLWGRQRSGDAVGWAKGKASGAGLLMDISWVGLELQRQKSREDGVIDQDPAVWGWVMASWLPRLMAAEVRSDVV